MEIALQCIEKSCHIVYALLPTCFIFIFFQCLSCLSPEFMFKAENIVSAFFTFSSLKARRDNVKSKLNPFQIICEGVSGKYQ